MRFSINSEGELTPKLNSRSSAGTRDLKIFSRLPAIVISDTGYDIYPFSIQKPDAPRL